MVKSFYSEENVLFTWKWISAHVVPDIIFKLINMWFCFQGPLQGFIEFLWFIAAFVGAPLYFGSIWAIYKFTQPEDSFEEISEYVFLDILQM